jgi:hypothetical protein
VKSGKKIICVSLAVVVAKLILLTEKSKKYKKGPVLNVGDVVTQLVRRKTMKLKYAIQKIDILVEDKGTKSRKEAWGEIKKNLRGAINL